MALYRLHDHSPQLAPDAWVAPGAQLIGRVQLMAQASIWYGSVLRGDNDDIVIGERSNVQDLSMLHTDPGMPIVIGARVTIGHQVMLHGCSVGDGTLIGIQTTVLNQARIGRQCLVGAGSLVTEGKVFPDGMLIMGRPAKVVRALEPQEIARIADIAERYIEQTARHRGGLHRLD